MSEAKNLLDPSLHKGPEVFSESYPIVEKLSVESLPFETTPLASSGSEKKSQNENSAFTAFAENFATFLLKFTLVSVVAFAAGVYFTTNILLDRIDHKSGWLKELLQFIKETSRYFLK